MKHLRALTVISLGIILLWGGVGVLLCTYGPEDMARQGLMWLSLFEIFTVVMLAVILVVWLVLMIVVEVDKQADRKS